MYFTRVWLIYAVSGNLFLNFIFSKENDSNFAFKKYIPPLRSMWRHLRFLLSKKFAIPVFGEKFILKNILQRKNLRKVMSFMTLKNVWAKALAKNVQKIFFMNFVCFSNLRARFSVFFSAFFSAFFFYSFLSAVITKKMLNIMFFK